MNLNITRLSAISDGLENTAIWPQWEAVESNLGLQLPIDYKQLVQAGGTGIYGGLIQIFSPFASNDNLINIHREELQQRRTLLKAFAGSWCDMFPTYPGLLIVGGAEDGYRLAWRVDRGAIEKWQLHWIDSYMNSIEHFCEPISSYLLSCMVRTRRPRICDLLEMEIRSVDSFFEPTA